MPVKIRLSRKGKKKQPIYHIVVADSRAPRDGKFIEKIGIYNPSTNPATIDLNFDKALDWLNKGAQPTDTAKSLLSTKGVMLKKHLLEGVKKNALTLDQADAKFDAWMKDKETKLKSVKDKVTSETIEDKKKRLAAELKKNEERAALILKKNSKLTAEVEKADETPAEEATAETKE